MKLFKIIGHPVVVISIFLLLLISGEQFGGFYLLYILLGLPNGAPHAVIAVLGILCMLMGYGINTKQLKRLKPLSFVIGDVLMILALVVFFKASKGYNDATFHQIVPISTLVLFSICIILNLLSSAVGLLKWRDKNGSNYGITS